MNTIINDANEQVIAAGQPGSMVWVRTMYPMLIGRVNAEPDYDTASALAKSVTEEHWPMIMKLSKHCTI